MKVRTRFAPSPTGHLHIGNIRTALYSWLFARKLGGDFILRIEDTDFTRLKDSSLENIINSMKWLNINWDEGPYFQTKRLHRYNEVIQYMLSKEIAYKCYCSEKKIKILRDTQISKGEKPRYNNLCRKKNNTKYDNNKPYVVRFKNPQTGSVVFNDLVRGIIKFKNKELDDLIILRTNGLPTYNFCAVIDDMDMNITHVIRGEDHINNTPRQINIFNALNKKVPFYAHVSMISNQYGEPLSKRYDKFNIMQYRDEGFLPEAILNYLVRLGWSHGNKEIFTINEMQILFNFNSISKSVSKFNIKKLLWLNHYYINNLPPAYVANHLIWHLNKYKINIDNGPDLRQIISLLGPRYKTLKEIAVNCSYFYDDDSKFHIKINNIYFNTTVLKLLKNIRNKLNIISQWTLESVNTAIKTVLQELNISMIEISIPLRLAITGSYKSPNLSSVIYTIGKKRSLVRIDLAINYIFKHININFK